MSALRGKILLALVWILAIVTIAGSGVGAFYAATPLTDWLSEPLTAVDWNLVKIIFTAIVTVMALLITLPTVIVASQVSSMYDVNRKTARWSPLSIVLAILTVLLTAGAVYGVIYEVTVWEKLLLTLVPVDIVRLKIIAGIGTGYACLLLLLPLLVSVRMHDSVGALLHLKRERSSED